MEGKSDYERQNNSAYFTFKDEWWGEVSAEFVQKLTLLLLNPAHLNEMCFLLKNEMKGKDHGRYSY